MNSIVSDLRSLVEEAAERLATIPESRGLMSGINDEWSAKQILGHLIDSAANNHQRFVRAQFTDDLVCAGYDQEQWVEAQGYDREPWPALISLWRAYNLHLAHVLEQMSPGVLSRPRHPHTLDRIAFRTVPVDQPVTLEYLARDYLDHLLNHLEQIWRMALVARP